MSERDFTPSSACRPCAICGRTKDGDCRALGDGVWFCHTHRGDDLKPGAPAPTGSTYRFVGGSSEAQGFGIWRPQADWADRSAGGRLRTRKATHTSKPTSKRTAMAEPVTLTAKLIRPQGESTFTYCRWDGTPVKATKRRTDHGDGRGKDVTWRPTLSGEGLRTADLAPYRWHQAIDHQRRHGGPVLISKGELKVSWAEAIGLQAISIHGWDDLLAAELLKLGRDAVLVPDCDLADLEGWYAKACRALPQARHLFTPGANWADPPKTGGVGLDDWLQLNLESVTPNTASQLLAAITDQPWGGDEAEDEGKEEGLGRMTRAALQAFLAEKYRLEFNELTRDTEIDGNPMGPVAHLADSFLAAQHRIEVQKQIAIDSFEYLARSAPYNPVKRYLLGLRERSDLRLTPMAELAAAFAIEPGDQLSMQMLARHLAGAALRGMSPGHKHDQMLVIAGDQGNGKSSAVEALAGPWYDSATRVENLEDKDFLARINGAWLFEIEECEHTLLKRTASEFKGFITRRDDRYVEKYEKQATTHKRRSALFGTTNHREFLNDVTGNRRIWVIDVGDRPLDPEWIAANRDSIWATVLTWIDWGLPNHSGKDDDMTLAAGARALEAQLTDPWEGPVAQYLESACRAGLSSVGQSELIEAALQIPIGQVNRDVQMRVTRIVTGAGFRTHNGTVAWKRQKARHLGGPPRAGYVPHEIEGPVAAARADVPTSAGSGSEVGTEVGTGQTPWQNCNLTTLFQPFRPFSKERVSDGVGEGPALGDSAKGSLGAEVGTGRHAPEIALQHSDLPVLTGSARQGGRHGTPPEQRSVQLSEAGTAPAAPADTDDGQAGSVAPPETGMPLNPTELAANAARSNLTGFSPGDRVYVRHQRLPLGRLHPATVTKVVNASVHFEPALEGLLEDPANPGGATWLPPSPLITASNSNCLPERGTSADPDIEHFHRDGQPFRRFGYSRISEGGTTATVSRELPDPRLSFQPLDGDGLDSFLAGLALQQRLLDAA